MVVAQSTQLTLFAEETVATDRQTDTSSTFVNNLRLAVHRWFRYSAGFSATWVRSVVAEEKAAGRTRILDPFSGSGTVLLEAEAEGLESQGVENHPFVSRIARAKLLWRESPSGFLQYGLDILQEARSLRGSVVRHHPRLLQQCFLPECLTDLDALHSAWERNDDGSAFSILSWLALVSILRDCSPVGTAQWQYVLPNKSKSGAEQPFDAYERKLRIMAYDMTQRQRSVHGPAAIQHVEDARSFTSVPEGWADLVITSPPYANNYDYADATRLEMTFMGELESWSDLQTSVRSHLVRSCTQHVAPIVKETSQILQHPSLEPIGGEIAQVCENLDEVRTHHGGKKPYHAMIANYFLDMAAVWRSLRRACREGAKLCLVVGDSAPYGVYVPVDRWLGELALRAGFREYRFEKTRDRNVKWKNRKHRVPLHEGRLWVEG
jgi:DNA modification methylase